MPNLVVHLEHPHEHHPPHSQQPHLPQAHSNLPPISLAAWSGSAPDLHHYTFQDGHQDQNRNLSMQQPLTHQQQPPHQLPRDHLLQQQEILKDKNSVEPEHPKPRPNVTAFSTMSAGTKRSHNDGEQPESEREDAQCKNPGRKKIKIEYIDDKSRRHITFSKRKAGIMKKAHELATLTGTQVLLLVVSETGLVYTFTTPKLQPLVTKPEGKNLIQACLNVPDFIPAIPETSTAIPRTHYYTHDTVPINNVGLPTESFYDGRKYPHSQNHVSTPAFNFASLGHLGYDSPYFQTLPVTHVSMGAAPEYLGYPYTQSPQLSQYSASSSYANPAPYWAQSESSLLPGSSSNKPHHHSSSPLESPHLSNSPDGMQLPSPPIEGLKDWRSAILDKCTSSGTELTSPDETH